ncbi:probable serine/threonine-protein kinase WNK5 isoform X2 [Lotus japonicus]|uniref:probable serine/threonine-protein kinase WNK5 isoform X2 n=1 Tax=Lotus japonicus TaxID=34305 RepID=UPI00258C09C9|nr:probable serine/threonine-protein kinase WNK5 isoform X2 [Lotus japonicus]
MIYFLCLIYTQHLFFFSLILEKKSYCVISLCLSVSMCYLPLSTIEPMVTKHISRGAVEMTWMIHGVDYSRLSWLLFGVFSMRIITMYKGRFCTNGGIKAQLGYVETDPSNRYGRFRDVLGKGAMKTVYRAFDEHLGIEVAWNQVKLGDVFHSPEQLQRLYSEVHLLKHLDHQSMMIFYGSWIDVNGRTFNFITELFTSGTLREYRQKYKQVDMRALKNWAHQILCGLEYLHSCDPPVIHRDLKCDNIFVNGHMGQIKIGDLGLAAILCSSQVAHSVIGTPEFMAPELYEERYNELVDIYSFGMCMIEMLTLEFPYSECSNPAQIYKKVTSGKLPDALYRIQDLEARRFVGRCLTNVSRRPSAKKLLLDPFLATEQLESLPSTPISTYQTHKLNSTLAVANEHTAKVDKTKRNTDMTITGTINEENNTIFLKVQIPDEMGKAKHIFFPFDTRKDTAAEVAMEMVQELEISHFGPLEIAAMIDHEISALAPTWKDRGKCKHQPQHSFNYEEDEDINNHHPFFLSSSSSSSHHGSLPKSSSSSKTHIRGNHHKFTQDDDMFMNGDASSQSSMNSYKCSNFQYCHSVNKHPIVDGNKHNNKTSTRPHRAELDEANISKLQLGYSTKDSCNFRCGASSHGCSGQTKVRSYVDDRRSQQVQRSMILEMYKNRNSNTIGGVEGIGFQPPKRGGRIRRLSLDE